MASTPEPQPTSSRLPRSACSASSSRQSRVVACAPVPKARPGSITTVSAPCGGGSHGGPIQSRPTATGRWNPRQRVGPVLRDVGRRDLAERPPEPRGAVRVRVGGELEPLRPAGLLESLGEKLEHHRPGPLGLLGRHLHGDATERAQRNALFSLSKKPSSSR